MYYLVYWEEENKTSIVESKAIVEAEKAEVGKLVQLKWGRKVYSAKILGSGSKETVKKLLQKLNDKENYLQESTGEEDKNHAPLKDKNLAKKRKADDEISNKRQTKKKVAATILAVTVTSPSKAGASTSGKENLSKDDKVARRSESTVVVLERNIKMVEEYFLAQLASFKDEYKTQSRLIKELQQKITFLASEYDAQERRLQKLELEAFKKNRSTNNTFTLASEAIQLNMPFPASIAATNRDSYTLSSEAPQLIMPSSGRRIAAINTDSLLPAQLNMPSPASIYSSHQQGAAQLNMPSPATIHYNLGLSASTPTTQGQCETELFKPMPLKDVIEGNIGLLRCSRKAGRLAVKLARESFFGIALMKRSTFSILPKDKLKEIKHIIFKEYKFENLVEFEPVWQKCTIAIGKACQTLRIPKFSRQENPHELF